MNYVSFMCDPTLIMERSSTISHLKHANSIKKKHHFTKFNGKLDSVQYSAAVAVTGSWRGKSRDKLYAELGWQSLSSRRWSGSLTLFYPVPPLHQSQYSIRKRDVVGRMGPRRENF